MPYVQREDGRIVGRYNLAQPGITEEFLPDDDPELIASMTPVPSPLDQLEALITQGQLAMEEAPLPADIQRQIFDLEVFVQNYYRRGAINLVQSAIEEFSIASDRTDVTEEQRAQVENLKSLMLGVFNVV